MRLTHLSFSILPFLLFALAACSPSTNQEAEEEDAAAPLTDTERQQIIDDGKAIAQATFAELSSNLAVALSEGGVENAVQYCNLVAYPLVDSLSEVHDAIIRRTSLQVRNPRNQPSVAERTVLQAYQEQAARGDELKPRVERLDDQRIAFYAPIKIQPLCLQCHGKVGEDVQESDYALIRELYPEDQATGYEPGQLRGMWSITFRQ